MINNHSMKILAADTSHGSCSVAILNNGKIIYDITDNENGKQAERLLSIIEEGLKQNSLTYKDLDALAVNIGPGSFTGIRIGVAAIRGLHLVNKTPLIAVNSLEAIAYPLIGQGKDIVVVTDAKRKQLYCQLFSQEIEALSEACLISYDEIKNFIPKGEFYLTGTGSHLVSTGLNNFKIINPDAMAEAKHIAKLAAIKLESDKIDDTCFPLYIRKPDAVAKQD